MPRPFVLLACPVLLAFALGLLTGCASSSPLEGLPRDLAEMSVVSVRHPGGHMPATGHYAWLPGSRVLIDDPRLRPNKVDRMVREAMRDSLARRGYTRSGTGEADVLLGYVVSLESALDGGSVSRMFGLDPGLTAEGTHGHTYDKGMLVVEIVSAKSRRPVWRGAVQLRADLDLDEEVRVARTRLAVDTLFDDLPNGS